MGIGHCLAQLDVIEMTNSPEHPSAACSKNEPFVIRPWWVDFRILSWRFASCWFPADRDIR